MKQLIIILSLLLITFTACEKDQDMVKVLPVDQLVAPVLASPGDIVVTADNLSENITFKWQHADFGVVTEVEYFLYVQVGAADPVLVMSGTGDSLDVKIGDLNTSFLKGGAVVGVASNVNFMLSASISASYAVISSAPVVTSVTAFAAVPVFIHLIGNVLGAKEWSNANYEYVMFRNDNLSVNVYTTYFRAGGFKFISNDDLGTWDNLYGQTSAGVLGNQTGNDITDITTAGYYTVTADISQLTYSITPYDASSAPIYTNIGLIGVGGDWDNDINMTQTDYDSRIWIVDNVNLPAGELKFRANHGWDANWGAIDQFPFGKGTSGGPNINVTEAAIYFVKFNDLTGHYVFYKK
ncbi:MAG: SusE domain-containing protein [Prevotellaceae bacterium]|jgi:hypothetical protein|nr:SusE domain-containing protein [Prevotellaceae bacterium]